MNNKTDISPEAARKIVIDLANRENIDFYSGNNEDEKIKNLIEFEFKQLIELYRRSNKKVDSKLEYMFLSGPKFRKRKKAILNYAKKAKELFKDKYPNLSVELEFVKLAAQPTFGRYEDIDSEIFFCEAAALYILEELTDINKETDAFKYMPKDEESLFLAVTHPEAKDCMFADELIQSMCYLLQNQTPLNKNEESFFITDELSNSPQYEIKQYNSPRNNKEKMLSILSLMPQYKIDKVVEEFKKDFWHLFETILEIENYYQESFDNIGKNTIKLFDELEQQRKEIDSPLIVTKPSTLDMKEDIDRIYELLDVQEDIINTKNLLRLGSCFMYNNNEILDEEIEQEFREKLLNLEISNPYETCFAFMYLLVTNDNILWLLNPCITLLEIAGQKLPWTKDYNVAKETNDKENKLHEKRMKDLENISDEYFEKEIAERNKELYKIRYNDSSEWLDYHNADEKDLLKLNFPQFIFNFNNIIPPRDFLHSNIKEDSYLASNFSKEQLSMLPYIYYLLEESGMKISFETETETKDDETNSEQKYIETINSLNEDKGLQTKRIKTLKQKVSDLQNSYKELKKEFNKYKQDYSNDTDEIYRLRELVYTLQNQNVDEQVSTKEKIEVPYYSNSKAVVIGGSDNWIGKMKEVLNNVPFISSKQRINNDVIKNAKIIWIQIIGLAHSDFYAITNYSKAHHIPIYYFSYSNIDKCLEQFVNIDQKSN